jgi:hypothetical protein
MVFLAGKFLPIRIPMIATQTQIAGEAFVTAFWKQSSLWPE